MTIALYLRLSEADDDLGSDGKKESYSIENQRALIKGFIENKEELQGYVVEYVDDGYTGTNFKRPSFTQLIEDAKKGLIQVVIVKDFSRLGRDYITVGDYVEQIFPMLGVRFISVNDNYDSISTDNPTMSFGNTVSNLINTLYSRDMSKKIRSSRKVLWEKGYHIQGSTPFGYVRDSERKGKWKIDPEAAATVRIIFEKAVEGMNTSQIAAFLNKNGFETPGTYNKKKRLWNHQEYVAPPEEQLWDSGKVSKILKKQEYAGALVGGKFKSVAVGDNRKKINPKNTWTITENAHEAIVSQEEFELANEVIRRVRCPDYKLDQKYSLRGKVRCGTCKLTMNYVEHASEAILRCHHGIISGYGSKCCTSYYSLKKIETVVLTAIKELIACVANYSTEEMDNGIEKKSQSIESKRREIETLKAEKIQAYEFYADGLISKEQYLERRKSYSTRIESIQSKLEVLLGEEEAWKANQDKVTKLIKKAHKHEKSKTLTREMVNAFIDAVYIYDEKKIEIVFSCEDAIELVLGNKFEPTIIEEKPYSVLSDDQCVYPFF